jgi:DNA invertase Pin-like site-specific DNA recombinase
MACGLGCGSYPRDIMRVIGYLRTSCTNTADHEDSIAEQKRKICTWAQRHGHEVVAWFSDEGVSGTNAIDDREALP